MSFHKNLVSLRKKKGLSQEQLASKLGVSRQSVSKWETGISQPELPNIEKICEVLEITPNELMGYSAEISNKHIKSKNIFISIVIALVVAFVFIFLSLDKEEHYGFYVNDLKIDLVETNDQYQIYNLSFVPSVFNNDYEYSIVVSDEDGNTKIFNANLQYNICFSKIELQKNKDVTIYAQIKSNNITFSSPLMKVWAMEEDGL